MNSILIPFSPGVYQFTILKLARNPFVQLMAALMTIALPLATLDATSTDIDRGDSFIFCLLLAIVTVSSANPVGSWFSMGGKGDYMPLILTRPMSRFALVISKWLALTTFLAFYSFMQLGISCVAGLPQREGWTAIMVASAFLDRLFDASSIAAWFVFIFLLPNQFLVLSSMVVLELAAFIRMFLNYSMVVPSLSGQDVLPKVFSTTGAGPWVMHNIVPFFTASDISGSLNMVTVVSVLLQEFLAPQLDVYDTLMVSPFSFEPVVSYFFNLSLVLLLAGIIMDKREFNYATE